MGHGNKSETQHYIWVTLTGTHTNKGTPPQSDSQIIIGRRETTKDAMRGQPTLRENAHIRTFSQNPRHATGKCRPANSRVHLTVVKDQTPNDTIKVPSIWPTNQRKLPFQQNKPKSHLNRYWSDIWRNSLENNVQASQICPVYRKLQMLARSIP